jgi:hypothetical protein
MQGIRLAGIIHSIVEKRHGLQGTAIIAEWLRVMLRFVDIEEPKFVKKFLNETESCVQSYKAASRKLVGYNGMLS